MTDNPYMKTRERYGHQELYLDLAHFAADLAATETLVNEKAHVLPNAESFDDDWRASIALSCNRQLLIHKVHGAGKHAHLEATIRPADTKLAPADWPRDLKFPSATFNTGRPLQSIAADIKRRVLDPAAEPLRLYHERVNAIEESANALERHAERLRAAYRVDVRVEPGNHHNASIFARGAEPYFYGRLYADGSVGIDRIGTLDAETWGRVAAALGLKK